MSPDAVHIGKDGWLFLVEGTNKVVDLYGYESSFTDIMARKWVDLLQDRMQRLEELNIKYVHVPAPEKLTVLHKFYDGEIENIDNSPIMQLSARYANRIQSMVNPLPYFARQVDKHHIYWKTDTHWSCWGCYAAYQLLCNKLGVEANTGLLNYPFNEGKVMFDLGAKLPEPAKETGRFYHLDQNAKRRYANPMVRFKEENGLINESSLHVGSHVIYENTADNAIDKRLILFGDSFSEYRPHLLMGMLAETFREVHFIWNSNIDYEYVRMIKPDFVVTELAERFMTRLPKDDLDIQNFSNNRLAEFRKSNSILPWLKH